MFAGGLLMAAFLLHAYLIFALAWSLVLNTIGVTLLLRYQSSPLSHHEEEEKEEETFSQDSRRIPTTLPGGARSAAARE